MEYIPKIKTWKMIPWGEDWFFLFLFDGFAIAEVSSGSDEDLDVEEGEKQKYWNRMKEQKNGKI